VPAALFEICPQLHRTRLNQEVFPLETVLKNSRFFLKFSKKIHQIFTPSRMKAKTCGGRIQNAQDDFHSTIRAPPSHIQYYKGFDLTLKVSLQPVYTRLKNTFPSYIVSKAENIHGNSKVHFPPSVLREADNNGRRGLSSWA
jgi:hypothetical protein